MRVRVIAVTLLLAGLIDLRSGAAQSIDAGIAPAAKLPGHGFDWFFAQAKPQMRCDGKQVVATWYASGSRTASGEAFNPNGYTAAHRTLPFGSQVTVTNPRNGKSITVTINDRGPFVKRVTLDLARGAARAIGMKDTQWICMSEASR
jgi:rare lipoprotein A